MIINMAMLNKDMSRSVVTERAIRVPNPTILSRIKYLINEYEKHNPEDEENIAIVEELYEMKEVGCVKGIAAYPSSGTIYPDSDLMKRICNSPRYFCESHPGRRPSSRHKFGGYLLPSLSEQ